MAEKKTVKRRKLTILKRQRQNTKQKLINKSAKTAFKTNIKNFLTLKEFKQDSLSTVHSTIDKARSKGVISKNKASRKKSITSSFYAKVISESKENSEKATL